jgi:hypothetical protein
MEDDFVHNNPRDPPKEIFERLESQVTDNYIESSFSFVLALFPYQRKESRVASPSI